MPSLDEIAKEIGIWRREKGFYSPDVRNFDQPCKIEMTEAEAALGKLALLHSEVSEASEAVRKHDLENFYEEMADIFIRAMDLAESSGMNIEAQIEKKMIKNRERPFKHGKKTSL